MLQTYIENMLERQSQQQSHTWEGKKTVDGNGLDKAKETRTFWPHLQNGRQKTHQDHDARNGERQQATRKTGKEVVRRRCRLVWMLTSRGSSAGKRPTIVEKSHWPQRLTWAMSWWWWWLRWIVRCMTKKAYSFIITNQSSTFLRTKWYIEYSIFNKQKYIHVMIVTSFCLQQQTTPCWRYYMLPVWHRKLTFRLLANCCEWNYASVERTICE